MPTIVRPRPLPQPRAPWTFRETWPDGRTCLSNYTDDVRIQRGGKRLKTGRFDWMLRLYQHHGVTLQSAVVDGCVMYSREEWDYLCERQCCWLELVLPNLVTPLRTSFRTASLQGHRTTTVSGPHWAVPLHHYTED